jgi:hypothetical protein
LEHLAREKNTAAEHNIEHMQNLEKGLPSEIEERARIRPCRKQVYKWQFNSY